MTLEKRLAAYGRLLCDEPLKNHTTYRIGGPVRFFLYPKNCLCLMEAVRLLRQEGLPWTILGRGSNLLIPDAYHNGAVLSLERGFDSYWFSPDGILTAQAGCSLVALSHEAARRSLSGLEFASGIPGSVGGGLYMNAGAYREDLAGILLEVQVLRNNVIEWVSKEELEYSYRKSLFQRHPDWTVLAARFQLHEKDPDKIRSLMENRQERRMKSQPLDMPSAGSTFRNPESVPAWMLIDSLGLRGKKIGGAQVSQKHSNFIVNTGNATCQDVESLIALIRQQVKENAGIDLVPEVERLVWNG